MGSSTTTASAAAASSGSGRERAIEALLDNDPQGCFHRLTKIMEECVPAALSSRPNLVTRSALVEQAFSLGQSDIDSVTKYAAVFRKEKEAQHNASTRRADAVSKERIYNYQAKQNSVKRQATAAAAKNTTTSILEIADDDDDDDIDDDEKTEMACPVVSVTAALTRVFETMSEEDEMDLKALIRKVTSHSVLQNLKHDGVWEAQVQEMVLQAAKSSNNNNNGSSDDKAWLICILAILMGQLAPGDQVSDPKSAQRPQPEQQDVESTTLMSDPFRALQLGSVLSLLETDSRDEDSSFLLETDVLDYFQQASSVYEERMELQKARLLARLPTPPSSGLKELKLFDKIEPTENLESSNTPSSPSRLLFDALGRQANNDSALEVELLAASNENVMNEGSAEAARVLAINEAFGLLDAALSANDSSSEDDDEDEGDEEDDDDAAFDDDDNDSQESQEARMDQQMHDGFGYGNALANQGTSNSMETDMLLSEQDLTRSFGRGDNEGFSSNDGSSHGASVVDSGIIDEEEDDDEALLMRALSLSLHDPSQETALRVVTGSTRDEELRHGLAFSLSTSAETPISESSIDDPLEVEDDSMNVPATDSMDHLNLPPLPRPPRNYPFMDLLEGFNRMDCEGERTRYFDPSSLPLFGSIPSACVLLHLLRHLAYIEESHFLGSPKHDETSGGVTVPGGIGTTLFGTSTTDTASNNRGRDTVPGETDFSFSLQLLITVLLLVLEKRNEAIENFERALLRQRRASDGLDAESGDMDESEAPLSSEEQDDPALTLAMNYVEDDMPLLSFESLENKGMRRKAAAAAHDAASLLISLKKDTDNWKSKIKLYSLCSSFSMKALYCCVQSIVAKGLVSPGIDPVVKLDVLPSNVLSRLSAGLTRLLSVPIRAKYLRCVNGVESELEDVFLSFELYREALSTWAECVPLVFGTQKGQSELLQSLIKDCMVPEAQCQVAPAIIRSVDSLSSFPSSELEATTQCLQVLCRRLRVGDMLNYLVTKPLPYVAQAAHVDVIGSKHYDIPLVNSLIHFVATALPKLSGAKIDLQELYVALCHRYIKNILLMDGLYTVTAAEDDGCSTKKSLTRHFATGDLVRINASPSAQLQFDSTKCSDSIAVIATTHESTSTASGSSALQRASKVWGSVLSTQYFSPKTGVHRWAVRLDKCERGHVFVGVATAQASVKTYVGGDKFGWGMIGTQALWHDRRKIRGDFGATFQTGSTIIVTLDTDAGTLSLSSWREGSSSSVASYFPLESSPQALPLPQRLGQVGTIDDWGIAFEGLPLDARLYPAVGLYQRDDKVTLYKMDSEQGGTSAYVSGACYFPLPSASESELGVSVTMGQYRRLNDLITWDGIQFVALALKDAVTAFEQNVADDFWVKRLLPSLGAALCLVPHSIPTLSTRFALVLIPHLTRCISELKRLRGDQRAICSLFDSPKSGKWKIRATGSSSLASDFEEYVVDIETCTTSDGKVIGLQGNGVGTTGKSKNGLVSIYGTTKGSSLHFVEEWSDGSDGISVLVGKDDSSSCVVAARLSLDGERFEGVYRNVQYGTVGQIVGIKENTFEDSCKTKDPPRSTELSTMTNASVALCESILCLAFSHLSTFLSTDVIDDQSTGNEADYEDDHIEALRAAVSYSFLSSLSLPCDVSDITKEMNQIRATYPPPDDTTVIQGIPWDAILGELKSEKASQNVHSADEVVQLVEEWDESISPLCGGYGSMSSLCRNKYLQARKHIIAVCLYVSNGHSTLKAHDQTGSLDLQLKEIWNGSLQILEDGVRAGLAKDSTQTKRESCEAICSLYLRFSQFILSLEFRPQISNVLTPPDVMKVAAGLFSIIRSVEDIKIIEEEMRASSRRAILRLVSIHGMVQLVSKCGSNELMSLESLCVCIPRILGRGQTDFFLTPRRSGEDLMQMTRFSEYELDGHYLSGLAGSDSSIRQWIEATAQDLVHQLSRLLSVEVTRRNGLLHDEVVLVDSLTLSILAVFAVYFRRISNNVDSQDSSAIHSIIDVLSVHRGAGLAKSKVLASSETEIVANLQALCQRDISRSILRCGVAVIHVLTHQVSEQRQVPSVLSMELCANVLLNELEVLSLQLEQATWKRVSGAAEAKLVDEVRSWTSLAVRDSHSTRSKYKSRGQHGRVGLLYLEENGTMLNGAVESASQKMPSHSKTSSNSVSSRVHHRVHFDFSHHYLSHWLHILCCSVRVKETLSLIVSDTRWLQVLMAVTGLTVAVRDDKSVASASLRDYDDELAPIPARFRSRLLRLITPFIVELGPNKPLALGFIALAGATSNVVTRSLDEGEGQVSREAVSLLRSLHSPALPEWRACVNAAIEECSSCSRDHSLWFVMQVGVLTFFSGDIAPLGSGSHVLLKPSAAAALSPGQLAPSVGKINSNGSTSPPSGHLAGNGTESILAGLCRYSASAGVVSYVDMKNGLCEVILVSRQTGSEDTTTRRMASATNQKGRQTLTVRALRTPLSDTVVAQETPLFLGDDIPAECIINSMLLSSVTSCFAAIVPSLGVEDASSIKEESVAGAGDVCSGIFRLSSDLLVMRTCIVLMSEKRLLLKLMDSRNFPFVMNKVLHLALPNSDESAICSNELLNDIQSKALSSLPLHEARLYHLFQMMKEVTFRMNALGQSGDKDIQQKIEQLVIDTTTQAMKVDREVASASLAPDTSVPGRTPRSSNSNSVSTTHSSSDRHGSSQRSGSENTAVDRNRTEDDDESEAAVAHLETLILQMAELGLPRSWSELALRRTGGTDIEAAVTFCLERGGDMEQLLLEERERERILQQGATASSSRRRAPQRDASSHLLKQLLEMGFPRRWCVEGLTMTGNNVDEALTWILTNGERLSEEDEIVEAQGDDDAVFAGIDDDEESGDDENDEDEGSISDQDKEDSNEDIVDSCNEEPYSERGWSGWSGSITPLRFISGRASIDSETMEVSGLQTGGFSSVGTKGVLLTHGKWYYEALLDTAGCLQIGWADGSFAGHCNSDRGDGCGDGPSSWAFDGWRRYRWHATATEWGCRWKEGDTLGCMVDMDNRVVSFRLNGKGEEIGMGPAFSGDGFRPVGGVYACVSFNRKEKLHLILGGKDSRPFKYAPPPGYRGVGEAVLNAVEELEDLLQKEKILGPMSDQDGEKKFLCDFSDGDHGHELMAWAHRYYGSDASVHLGTERNKIGTSINIASSVSNNASTLTSTLVSNRTLKLLTKQTKQVDCDLQDIPCSMIIDDISTAYDDVMNALSIQAFNESMIMSILLARKLILHVMITAGSMFDPTIFVVSPDGELDDTRRFWNMMEVCTSLRNAGWVGEAGVMALAAEALGLGISSNDSLRPRASTEKSGLVFADDLDEGLQIASCGISQLLSSIRLPTPSAHIFCTNSLPAAAAEAAFGSSSGGGILAFLKEAIQSSVCKSSSFRNVVAVAVRRAVRLLAVVEYDRDVVNEQPENENDSENVSATDRPAIKTRRMVQHCAALNPDARLASYLTGLLLSSRSQIGADEFSYLQGQLASAWSIGLLSASMPWRMISGFTVAGILNQNPGVLSILLSYSPTVTRYFGRLPSTTARRIWAERAASPICSRYTHAMLELLTSVQRAIHSSLELPEDFTRYWYQTNVDAATPIPLQSILQSSITESASSSSWECGEGFMSRDDSWVVWTGAVDYLPIDWEVPSRSAVRSLMDAGEGPPMLWEGCFVMRGPDWDQNTLTHDEDGKPIYDAKKSKKDAEKRLHDKRKEDSVLPGSEQDPSAAHIQNEINPADPEDVTELTPVHMELDASLSPETNEDPPGEGTSKNQAKKKIPSPKLPLGTVLAVEPWNGVEGMGRRVRWHLTGEESVYRFGGDGGRYDVCHVEANEKQTRVKKRHPLPESAEQCAARHGFGARKSYSVILRIYYGGRINEDVDRDNEVKCQGILEWPDFGAGAEVTCIFHQDGAVTIQENKLLFGAKDFGWEARFGQPSFVPGTSFILSPTSSSSPENQSEVDIISSWQSSYDKLLGSSVFQVEKLRNRSDGGSISITSEMRLFRGRRGRGQYSINQCSPPPPITFDQSYHAPSISLSKDGRTASCIASEGRGTVYGSVGFTKGVHYWEVKLEQADIGSVFIGIAEKPSSSESGSSRLIDTAKLNRWHGWGFVNFRATYTSGAERVYGAHCHAGDTVGVLLDCDAGRVSFFFDGLKYGEHILNDLGCAFENISPFGFNCDGCSGGGAGQGAPSGFENGRSGRFPVQGAVRPRTLWPVIGLRNQGDRVTFSTKWNTSYGVDGTTLLRNIIAVDEVIHRVAAINEQECQTDFVPDWLIREAYNEYNQWFESRWLRSATRGSGPCIHTSYGLTTDFDTSPKACAAATASLGIPYALLSGDRVKLTRSAGRILELEEEAVVLGAFQGQLYYRIVSQKSEGGSLTEGGGRAWHLDESEVVDGLPFVNPEKGLGVKLPRLDRFRCLSSGGLRIVFEGGAVVRSDLEIFDGSSNLGSIPFGTVIPRQDVLERRVNSCGVVRYRVIYKDMGEGWISARIRGGKEECIVECVSDTTIDTSEEARFPTPADCAEAWYTVWEQKSRSQENFASLKIKDLEAFRVLVSQAILPGVSRLVSDSTLAAALSAISNFYEGGNAMECSFQEVAAAFSFVVARNNAAEMNFFEGSSPAVIQATAAVFARFDSALPSLPSLLARVAVLKALNRRLHYALPWLPLRPCQEGSGMFGGLSGFGTSIDRAGRTKQTQMKEKWVTVPSIALNLRKSRSLIFTSVKRELLAGITDATTTPTPLSHDEYELPREIRTVRVNRLKATRAMMSEDSATKRKYSVFAQLQNETRTWGGAALRRGYVAKGHGGQKRAFKVKLIGEGVNDYSGPYREVFTDAFVELMKFDSKGSGALGVLDPTPNNAAGIGEGRELFIFSSNGRDLSVSETWMTAPVSEYESRIRTIYSTLLGSRDEATREVEESLVFLGRLTGTAFRHGILVDLPLPLELVWKSLSEDETSEADQLQEIDYLAYRQRQEDEHSPLLVWEQRMLNSFVEGLSNVVPVEILPIFTGEELRGTFCGSSDVDVELLKQVVEYEGFEETDKTVDYFWETLRDLTNDERKQFLQFVWARNRLPLRGSDLDVPFKLQKDTSNTGERADQALPSASTCFFSLTLPEYSSQEILKRKLLFAIQNVTTMETDFQTNTAEISEGYRAL